MLGALLLTIGTAFGQASTEFITSEPCQAVAGLSREDLEKRRLDLEEAVASMKVQVDVLASTEVGASSEALKRARQELDGNQVSLIDILYQLECFRSDLQRTVEAVRGGEAALSITVFYATNRRPTGSSEPRNFYGTGDTRQLAYGTTSISIPTAHKPGELELPSLWRFERNPVPGRHFLVQSVTPLDSTDARRQIVTALRTARSKSLLIFVHGFNVSFFDASLRTAQLAYDLRFPGIAMFYSWPSAGSTAGYLHDEESSQLARTIFDQMLDDLSALDFEQIYIVAHSMGNRVVGATLAQRVQERKDVSKVREILLAAPDINVEIFRTEIAPRLAAMQGARKTIYASSKDVALKTSSVMHGFARVGETKDSVFIHAGFDTIDATNAAPLARSFGHSYVLDSAVVLNDIEDVVVWRRLLSERSLMQLGAAPNVYWGIR
jgi:esterase/lipase superfamily enzyme